MPANLALSCFGPIAEPNAFGSVGDLRLRPDPNAALDVPADSRGPGVRIYLADQTTTDGTPWASCPRAMLTGTLERLRESTGLRVVAAFEHEFTLGGLASTGSTMSLAKLRAAEPFGSELLDTLETAGLEPDTWLAEYGDEQYEITLRPTDGGRAADRAVLLRELVRDMANRRGLRAGFAPMPAPGGVGSGVHVHLSLRDEDDRPVLYDPERPGRLSEVGARFCAGVVAHAAALTAITAPSPVSFLRLRPHMWSTAGAFVGERNREALLRICPTVGTDDEEAAAQFNLEYRAADATANPWLVLGAIVAAGMQGIVDGYAPPTIHPESITEQELAAVPQLPTGLPAALAALAADEVASGWFDPALLATFHAVKQAELAAVADLDDAGRCRRVADVY